MAYGDYVTSGTISVSNGGTTVTGSGTSWASGPTPALPGDKIYAGGQVNIVASVASNTSLAVRLPWTGTTLSGAAYAICLDAPSRQAAAKSSTAVNDLISRMQVLESSLYQPKVKTLGNNTPASTPAENDIHVAGTSPTGAWSGYANNYMTWTGSGWLPQAPQLGDAALIEATADLSIWNGAAWVTRPYTGGAVRYDAAQSLTSGQKAQALTNQGVSAFAQTILDDADAFAVRSTIVAQQAIGFGPTYFQFFGNGKAVIFGSAVVTTSSEVATVTLPFTFTVLRSLLVSNSSNASVVINVNSAAWGGSSSSFVVRTYGFSNVIRIDYAAYGDI